MSNTLDDYDLKLLHIIQRDARIPQSELGELVNLSTAAVNRRLKKLKAAGVITKYTALLNPKALDLRLTIIANVEVENEQLHDLDATRKSFKNCPFIQQVYYVTGEWDFVLIFLVTDMEHYNTLTQTLFFDNNNIKRFKTLVSMSNDKTGVDLALLTP
ncbi:Lrp/AsnC family transcriptional regulator [uncultured Shewanella sp.]|uniref:Lrp/AsnC family transcriptional regulator n=1 Tax=uncultured Shewanella sp. TaxID=173975 RepID=UPI0026116ED8|nr:Lrp/AsnC family transcriptional regulator [uncultured Shewanella sp.]